MKSGANQLILAGIITLLLSVWQSGSGIQAGTREKQTTGTLKFAIRDGDTGEAIPGKLVFLQDGKPVDVGVKSRGLIASRGSTVYTGEGMGTVEIPVGEYEVWAGRGIEYSADRQHITVEPEGKVLLTAKIRKVMDTKGFVGGDMHLHTLTYSGHGDSNVDERIISCVGEGLDWAVATDHNHVTDYAPVRKKLGLSDKMATTVGNEVSTPIGHFNAYPLPPGSDPVNASLRDANDLFKLIRQSPGEEVIQVNHPRWPGAAYFTELELDAELGTTSNPRFSWDFDAFEILNENRGLGWWAEPENPISVKEDWFNMLNRGQRFTAVGNSDSHDVMNIMAGMPRNYIACSTDNPAQISEDELVASIKRGDVAVCRGLFVELSAGEDVHMGQQTSVQDGKIDLHIRVQAPGWVTCDTVQIIGNGEVVHTYLIGQTGDVERFLATITLRPKEDTWYVAVATGSKSMAPLYHDAPVPITPLGFTNPIWVDADGDGQFTSLHDRAAKLIESSAGQGDKLIDQLKAHPALMKQAINYLATHEVPEESRILGELASVVNLDLRLAIYNVLRRERSAESRSVLKKAAAMATTPLEKLSVALALVDRGDLTQWPTVLETVGQVEEPRFIRSAVMSLSTGSYLRDWHVAAPFPHTPGQGLEQINPPEESEVDLSSSFKDRDGKKVSWKIVRANRDGIIDLIKAYGKQDNSTAYGYAEFQARADGDLMFLVGSDDGVVIWLNGKERHRHAASRAARAGDDMVIMPVKKGVNRMLLKVENGAGDWGFVVEPLDVTGLLD